MSPEERKSKAGVQHKDTPTRVTYTRDETLMQTTATLQDKVMNLALTHGDKFKDEEVADRNRIEKVENLVVRLDEIARDDEIDVAGPSGSSKNPSRAGSRASPSKGGKAGLTKDTEQLEKSQKKLIGEFDTIEAQYKAEVNNQNDYKDNVSKKTGKEINCEPGIIAEGGMTTDGLQTIHEYVKPQVDGRAKQNIDNLKNQNDELRRKSMAYLIQSRKWTESVQN